MQWLQQIQHQDEGEHRMIHAWLDPSTKSEETMINYELPNATRFKKQGVQNHLA